MPPKQTWKTLSFNATPIAKTAGVLVTVDIGKYYDNYICRLARAWCTATYQDISGLSGIQEAYCEMAISGLTTIRDITVTPTTGTAINNGIPLVPGPRGGEYNFLGDAILEDRVIGVQLNGYKQSAGAYPPDYNFFFDVILQFEFNFHDVNQDILKLPGL